MSAKKPKHKPLTPHLEGDFMEEVVVLRIPVGTPPEARRKAEEWRTNIAKKVSRSREDMYWRNQKKGNISW